MKSILIISQYYYPEQFAITHICEKLVQNGYKVTVLTGVPNYPMGNIFDGYKNEEKEEIINGVNVIRVPLVPRSGGMIKNYFSYARNASVRVKKIVDEFDFILVYEVSPITQVFPAYTYKKKHKSSKLIIYCQDIWPEVLINAGIKKNSPVFFFGHLISKYLYKKADKILVTSDLFSDYLYEEFKIKKSKCIYLPSYGDEWVLSVVNTDNGLKKRILFAGNIGKAQNLDILIDAVFKCRNREKLIVDIVGDGSEIERLKNKVKNMNLSEVVLFHGRKSGDELVNYYNLADAFFLSLNCDTRVCYTVPAKLQGYLGAGKVVISSIKGGASKILKEANAGIMAKYNDIDDLASKIDLFLESPNDYLEYGENGRNYFINNFTEDKYFKRLNSILCEMQINQ